MKVFFMFLLFVCIHTSSVFADECISGDCENYGTYRFSNGDIYTGGFKDHYLHGQGTYNFTTGDKYIGSWKDGFFHGQGIYTWSDGSKYTGEYKRHFRHGKGTFTLSNGNKYVGKFIDDGLEFHGTLYYANGDVFVGQIKDYEELLEGTFTSFEEKQIQTEKLKAAEKKSNIKSFKSDCEDIGFKDGTEAMGNCVLKLMELQGNNAPTIVTTTTSSSSQEIVDIEKQKLQAQREALKLQQDQLKAEQERVAQERRRDRKKAADELIQTGNCLMSGGGWGC